MRIIDWSSDVCSSDLKLPGEIASARALDAWYRKARPAEQAALRWSLDDVMAGGAGLDAKAFPAVLDIPPQKYKLEYRFVPGDEADGVTLHLPLAMLNALPSGRCEWLVPGLLARSEEHTSELQSLMRLSYAVFCL